MTKMKGFSLILILVCGSALHGQELRYKSPDWQHQFDAELTFAHVGGNDVAEDDDAKSAYTPTDGSTLQSTGLFTEDPADPDDKFYNADHISRVVCSYDKLQCLWETEHHGRVVGGGTGSYEGDVAFTQSSKVEYYLVGTTQPRAVHHPVKVKFKAPSDESGDNLKAVADVQTDYSNITFDYNNATNEWDVSGSYMDSTGTYRAVTGSYGNGEEKTWNTWVVVWPGVLNAYKAEINQQVGPSWDSEGSHAEDDNGEKSLVYGLDITIENNGIAP